MPQADTSVRMSLARALELAAHAAGRAYPKPTVGAVVVRDGDVVAEGVTERGGRHAETVALDAAGQAAARARRVFVTLEPCAHQGSTPPCTGRLISRRASRASWSAPATRTRRRQAGSSGSARRASMSSSSTRGRPGSRTRPGACGSRSGGRSSPTRSRPRSTGASRCRAAAGSPARRAAGSSTSSERPPTPSRSAWARSAPTRPRLDARDVEVPRGQPRRLAFGRGPLPPGSELELRSGPLARRARRARRRGGAVAAPRGRADARRRRSSRRGSSTSCSSSSRRSSPEATGRSSCPRLGSTVALSHLSARRVGEDVLLEAYVHEP